MYRITHDGTTNFPGQSAALEPVSNDDYVEWLYTRDLGEDIGGGPNAEENYKAANAVEALIAAIGDPVTLESEEAIADVYKSQAVVWCLAGGLCGRVYGRQIAASSASLHGPVART